MHHLILEAIKMENPLIKSICPECGYEFIGIDLSVPKKPPCPTCQSTPKKFSMRIHDEVKSRQSVRMERLNREKRRAQGKTGSSVKKPMFELFYGDDFSTKRGKYVYKTRSIDRENNLYFESITDKESGDIIHRKEEKLSDHKGHGSAKKT